MMTIREKQFTGSANISCTKYRNLKNISHFHSDYELVYVNAGDATVTADENIFNLSAGQCAFICGNVIHCITANEHTVITVLKLGNLFFEKSFSARALAAPVVAHAPYMADALQQIAAELRSDADYNALMAEALATRLLITLFRSAPIAEQSGQPTGKLKSHVLYHEINQKIAAEYGTVTLKTMAEHMHFSEPYFSKVFHSIFGMTFTQYLNTVKIAAAIEKIKERKTSITEIAFDCGFNTIRSFNRVFKSFTGYSPNTLPPDFVFLYCLQDGYGLDPTLNCTVVMDA